MWNAFCLDSSLYLCSSHCCIMCRRTLILRHHGDAKVEEEGRWASGSGAGQELVPLGINILSCSSNHQTFMEKRNDAWFSDRWKRQTFTHITLVNDFSSSSLFLPVTKEKEALNKIDGPWRPTEYAFFSLLRWLERLWGKCTKLQPIFYQVIRRSRRGHLSCSHFTTRNRQLPNFQAFI